VGAPQSNSSVGELLGMLAANSGTLIQQELRLASHEVIDRARSASGQIGFIALWGAVAHAGLLAILTSVMIGLSPLVPIWISSLVLGTGLFITGVVLVLKSIEALKHPKPAGPATKESLS
jgi:hypothetical protein